MTLTLCRVVIVYFYCHPSVPREKELIPPLRHEKTKLIVLTLQCEQGMDMDNQVAAVKKRSVVKSWESVTEMFLFRHLTLFSMKCWAVCTNLQWNTNLLFSISNVRFETYRKGRLLFRAVWKKNISATEALCSVTQVSFIPHWTFTVNAKLYWRILSSSGVAGAGGKYSGKVKPTTILPCE